MKNLHFKLIAGLVFLLFCNTIMAQPIGGTVTPTATTCGLNNGSAVVNPTGGTGAYTYHWYPSGLTTNTIFTQNSGPGSVTIFDGVDSVQIPYVIASSTAPTVVIAATRDTFCLNSNDTLTATPSGSGGTYTWGVSAPLTSGPTSANPLIVTTAAQGTYTVSVSWDDGAGCTATNTHTIQALNVSASLVSKVQPSCGRNTGQINCSVTGSRFYCQFFQAGIVIQAGGATSISNLLPGTYDFVVNELSTGCSATVSGIVLTDTTSYPTFGAVAVVPEQCFGNHNGEISVAVNNCASGCVFSWSQDAGNHTDTAAGLGAGTYIFSVNKGGCSNISDTIVVPGPATALMDPSGVPVGGPLRIHSDHCDRHVGTARLIANGGTPPYSYIWSQGTPFPSGNDSVTGLAGGGGDSVMVIVMDSHGCVDTLADTVGNTPGPSARITSPPDTVCATESEGTIIVQATSHDGPFTYHWTNGGTTPVIGHLPWGSYAVTVTNAVGCDTVLISTIERYNAYLLLSASGAIYQGQTVELTAQTNIPVKDAEWAPYIQGSRGQTQVYVTPQDTTLYSVILTYGQACKLYDTVLVTVLTDSSKMKVPNTFTPNDDGTNDEFYLISYQTTLKSFHIWIYDRWGGKVYESTDKDFHWKGVDAFAVDKPLNTGVFTYAIEYSLENEPDKKILGGNISLVK